MTTMTFELPPTIAKPSLFWRSDVVALLILTIVVIILRAPWLGDANADIDEQLYSLIGWEMTRGAVPFVDLWDRKPYGLFAIYAAAHAVGGPSPISYQIVAGLFTLAGAFMTYRLALHLTEHVTAIAVGVLYSTLISLYGAYSGQSEAFFIPLMIAMAHLVRDPSSPSALTHAFWAMLIGGFALQIKYTVVPQCIFFGLWALWGLHRNGRRFLSIVKITIIFGILGLLPTALVGFGYAIHGYWN